MPKLWRSIPLRSPRKGEVEDASCDFCDNHKDLHPPYNRTHGCISWIPADALDWLEKGGAIFSSSFRAERSRVCPLIDTHRLFSVGQIALPKDISLKLTEAARAYAIRQVERQLHGKHQSDNTRMQMRMSKKQLADWKDQLATGLSQRLLGLHVYLPKKGNTGFTCKTSTKMPSVGDIT